MWPTARRRPPHPAGTLPESCAACCDSVHVPTAGDAAAGGTRGWGVPCDYPKASDTTAASFHIRLVRGGA